MSQGNSPTSKRLDALEILSGPIDPTHCDEIIRNFQNKVDEMCQEDILKLFPNDRTCSLEFEGHDLLAILAQTNAKNIRFYFALHKNKYYGKKRDGTKGWIKPHLTLVAVAVNEEGNEMRHRAKPVPSSEKEHVPESVRTSRTGSGVLYEFAFPCPPC